MPAVKIAHATHKGNAIVAENYFEHYYQASSSAQDFSKNLSEEELKNLPDGLFLKLGQSYQSNNQIYRLCYPEHPMPIQDLYVRLMLIDNLKKQTQKERLLSESKDYQREDYLNHFESIHYDKLPIELNALYRASVIPRKTTKYFIEGRAGIGKSTLIQYIAFCWSLPDEHPLKLWKEYFQWLFVIPLRNVIPSATDDYMDILLNIIEQECFYGGPQSFLSAAEKKALKYVIKTQKVLLILDGYDEFNPSEDRRLKLFLDWLLNSPYIILTSRPHQFRPDKQKFTYLEVTGFNNEAMLTYVDKMYSAIVEISIGRIRQLKSLIKMNFNIQGIAHVPINLELLCSIWHQEEIELNSFTITDIYKKIVDLLSKRYLEKKNEPYGNDQNIFNLSECIAFIGMLSYKAMLSLDDIEKAISISNEKYFSKHQVLEKLKEIGFIKPSHNGLYFYFLHLSFQEYLAAGYLRKKIERLLKSEKNDTLINIHDFIINYKYDARYQVMWWFLAGRLAHADMESNSPLQYFFDMLCKAPFTLPGVYQLSLLIRCLNEVKFSKNIVQKKTILKKYADSLFPLIQGHAMKWNAPVGTNPDLKGDNIWLSYFLEVFSTCRMVLSMPELEEMFITGFGRVFGKSINVEYFRKLNLLSKRVLREGISHTGHLSFGGDSRNRHPKFDEYRKSLCKKYFIDKESEEDIESIIYSSNEYHRYSFIQSLGGLLLCKLIDQNPKIVLFLFELKVLLTRDVHTVTVTKRLSGDSFQSEIILGGGFEETLACIKGFPNYYIGDKYDIQLLFELADLMELLYETVFFELVGKIFQQITEHTQINQDNIIVLISNLHNSELILMLDVVLMMYELMIPEQNLIKVLERKFNDIDSDKIKLKIIYILHKWNIYDELNVNFLCLILKRQFSQAQTKRSYMFSEGSGSNSQLISENEVLDIVKKLMFNHVRFSDFKSIIIFVIINFSMWVIGEKNCLELLDYLFFELTTEEDRSLLLNELENAKDKNTLKLIRQINKSSSRIDENFSEIEEYEKDPLSFGYYKSSAMDSNKGEKSIELFNKKPSENNAKNIIDYINSNALLVYVHSSKIFYAKNKEIKEVALKPENLLILVNAFIQFSEMPLFLDENEAQSQGFTLKRKDHEENSDVHKVFDFMSDSDKLFDTDQDESEDERSIALACRDSNDELVSLLENPPNIELTVEENDEYFSEWPQACSILFNDGYRFLLERNENSLKLTCIAQPMEQEKSNHFFEKIRSSCTLFMHSDLGLRVANSTEHSFTLKGDGEVLEVAHDTFIEIANKAERMNANENTIANSFCRVS